MPQKRFCISEIATSHDGSHCAAVDHEEIVWVWGLTDGSLVSRFQSRYSLGGRRLAITPDGSLCAAAQYDKYGITAHRVSDGFVLWHREDLRGVQDLSYDTAGECWVACFSRTPCHLLQRDTGNTVATLPGVRRRRTSPYDDVMLVEKSRKDSLELCSVRTSKKIARVERRAPAVLDVCFGPGRVFTAEMTAGEVREQPDGRFIPTGVFDPPGGGPLRSVSVDSGELSWEYKPGEGNHFLRICYGNSTGKVYGILRGEYETGVVIRLVSLNADTGGILEETTLANACTEFALGGDVLVTSGGEVIDLTGDEPTVRLRLKTPN